MKLLTLALAGGLVASTIAMAADAPNAPPPSATQRAPETVYGVTCGYCHGRNVGPVVLGRKLPPDYIKMMARTGPNGMPSFRPTEITNAELDALAKWISKSKPSKTEHGQ